jgi:CRISPR-associated protein Csd1
MILQALSRYYERADAESGLAPARLEWKEISFVLVLDSTGSLLRIEDTRIRDKKNKLRGRTFLVPQTEKRASNICANLLWDTAEYVLGICRPDSKPDRVVEQHRAFATRAKALAVNDVGVDALNEYLRTLDLVQLHSDPAWPSLCVENPNISFRLNTDPFDMLICVRPAVLASFTNATSDAVGERTMCLVRNQTDQIARLHPVIKGVWGAQSSGANLVSFNLAAFNSYAKFQGANAPVGAIATFNYTTALNHLLRTDSKNRVQVGDASVAFWASEKSKFAELFTSFFNEPAADDPNQGVGAVQNLYRAVENGVYVRDDAIFYVLGLAPNAARISVRFWLQDSVANMATRIVQHFDDLSIARAPFEMEYLPLWRLLACTALLGKSSNVAPNLAGDTLRCVLAGLPYPATLLGAAIRRVRAERTIPHARAALIKACLHRQFRFDPKKYAHQELSVSLNPEHPAAGYQIGRLFAALERIQNIAQPGINANIRDRYYGAASATPASVLPILLKLKNHHVAKFDSPGQKVWAERLVTEIIGRLSLFPRQLSLQEQGLFAIGYYHQTQAFFTVSTPTTGESP